MEQLFSHKTWQIAKEWLLIQCKKKLKAWLQPFCSSGTHAHIEVSKMPCHQFFIDPVVVFHF